MKQTLKKQVPKKQVFKKQASKKTLKYLGLPIQVFKCPVYSSTTLSICDIGKEIKKCKMYYLDEFKTDCEYATEIQYENTELWVCTAKRLKT